MQLKVAFTLVSVCVAQDLAVPDARLAAVGRVQLSSQCTGTLIRVTGDLPVVLTAGHCIGNLGTNDVTRDVAVTRGEAVFHYFADTRDRQVRIPIRRILYATQKGVDLALLELERAPEGVTPIELADAIPVRAVNVGAPANDFLRRAECAQRPPADLLEHAWYSRAAIPNDCKGIRGGSSGSPMLDDAGRVFAVLFTSTIGSPEYAPCFLNGPCEIGDGFRMARDTNYSSPVVGLGACFGAEFDPALPGCPLDAGRQVRLTGFPLGATRPAVVWDTTVAGDGFATYRYKTGPMATTDCAAEPGYSAPRALSMRTDDAIPAADGRYVLCVVGAGQPLRFASRAHVWIDTTPPVVKPIVEVDGFGDALRVVMLFAPPELSLNQFKYGPPESTDCADSAGYRVSRQFLTIPARELPARLCVIGFDQAENSTPPFTLQLSADMGLTHAVTGGQTPMAPDLLVRLRGAGLSRARRLEAGDRPVAPLLLTDTEVVFPWPPDPLMTPTITVRVEWSEGTLFHQAAVRHVSPGLFAAHNLVQGVLELYGSGWRHAGTVTSSVGTVEYAGPHSAIPGLDQVNVRVGQRPAEITIRADGQPATVRLQ